jgi:hypothetical protein
MARMDGYIFNDVKVGDFVDTGGVYYGPYNKVICIAKSDHRIALHIKGHYQFWGRQRHYISAHCTVFDIEPSNLEGSRLGIRNIWEKECGRQSRAVQAEAIAIAQRTKSE